jgi:hypothetical protein
MRVFVPALFTSMVITVGVLIVCLTSPKPSMFEFEEDLEFPRHVLSTLENFNLNNKIFLKIGSIGTDEKIYYHNSVLLVDQIIVNFIPQTITITLNNF